MGTFNHNYKSNYNLLRGLRGRISTAIIGVISTLNLQVGQLSGPIRAQRAADGRMATLSRL